MKETMINVLRADLEGKIPAQEDLLKEIENKDLKQYHLGRLDTLREILADIRKMKTNRQWYFYEDQGACFKLINGELWMCSPNIDHTPDETDACFLPEEEWYENEPMTRDQMIKDLEEKE